MKYLLTILALSFGFNASATIDGPSCGDLTKAQRGYLKKAAKTYMANKLAENMNKSISFYGLNVSEADCHDYDGVHSSSIFAASWTKTRRVAGKVAVQMCEVELDVSTGWDQVKKLKTIDKNSTFDVEEVEEIECTD